MGPSVAVAAPVLATAHVDAAEEVVETDEVANGASLPTMLAVLEDTVPLAVTPAL